MRVGKATLPEQIHWFHYLKRTRADLLNIMRIRTLMFEVLLELEPTKFCGPGVAELVYMRVKHNKPDWVRLIYQTGQISL